MQFSSFYDYCSKGIDVQKLPGTGDLPMFMKYESVWEVRKVKPPGLDATKVKDSDFEDLFKDWMVCACEIAQGLDDPKNDYVFGSVKTQYEGSEIEPNPVQNTTEDLTVMGIWKQRAIFPVTQHYVGKRPLQQKSIIDLSRTSVVAGDGGDRGTGAGQTTDQEANEKQGLLPSWRAADFGEFVLIPNQFQKWIGAGKPQWFCEVLNFMCTKLPEFVYGGQLELDIGQVMAFNPAMQQRATPQPFHLDVAASSIYPQVSPKTDLQDKSVWVYPAGFIMIIPFAQGYHLETLKSPSGIDTFKESFANGNNTFFAKTLLHYRLQNSIQDVKVEFGSIISLPLSVIHRGQGIPDGEDPIKPLFRLHMFHHVRGHSKSTKDVEEIQLWECEEFNPEHHQFEESGTKKRRK